MNPTSIPNGYFPFPDVKIEDGLTFDDVSMVPRYSEIESRANVSTESQFTKHIVIPTPLVSAPMDTVTGTAMMQILSSLGVASCPHRFMSLNESRETIESNHTWIKLRREPYNVPVVATIGVVGDYQTRAEQALESGANIILIDVAHGDHIHVRRTLEWLNKLPNRAEFDVIAGNIATADGAQRLQDWGADALRVGIGGGSMCETRVRTGIGVPQLQAVLNVAKIASVPVISDGGIRYPGDVAKALASGADTVMIGSLFAGTTEAPGELFTTGQWPHEKQFKMYRGSASRSAKGGNEKNIEGTATMIPVKGPVSHVVQTIMEGVRSAMSYLGVDRVQDMRDVAEFVRITNAGLAEGHPHGLK